MKFPQNRTEIMDQVAAFAIDNDLSNKEKEPLIRLALMHWNHVSDRSMPKVEYDGFDPEWISPVKQLDLSELIDGAPEYIDQRCEDLNQELKRVSKALVKKESQRGNNFFVGDSIDHYDHVQKMNELYTLKENIVEELENFNYQVVDRVVCFEFHDASLNARVAKIKDIFEEIIATDSDFEVGVDFRVSQGRDTTSFSFFLNKDLVDKMVKTASMVFNDPEITKDIPDAIIREQHRALPSFKDVGDQLEMDRKQRKVKEQENDLSM
jgi:hypothetical protein